MVRSAIPQAMVLFAALMFMPSVASAQFGIGEILTAPKTLIDRAIEARSAEDIAADNEIVLKINRVMADLGTIKASTEIYEQRLLVTGMFDDKAVYDRFEKAVRGVKGVRKLYWHATYMGKGEQEKSKAGGSLLTWDEVTVMQTKALGRLVGTAGVADVNFRVAADSQGIVYLLGRVRSADERGKALARARDGKGVRKVVSYVDVRP